MWAILGCLHVATAASVSYTENTEPPGVFSATTVTKETPTNVVTRVAPSPVSGCRFAYWTLFDGVSSNRADDVFGTAMNPFSFTILSPSVATAHYMAETNDTDSDGVFDWYEIRFFNLLSNGPGSDTDTDGFTLREEFIRDWHPCISNTVTDGGISGRRSLLRTVILDPSCFLFERRSDPPGLHQFSAVYSNGVTVVLPELYGSSSGYRFGQWYVNGTRVTDAFGRSIGYLPFVFTGTTDAVAMYYPETSDTDMDDLPDWFEWHFYGNLADETTSDTDGDGFDLWNEYVRDYHPNVSNTVRDGGISGRRSLLTPFYGPPYIAYVIQSDPAGLVYSYGYVTSGTTIATACLSGGQYGYSFGYWTVNGARQEDSQGLALNRVVTTMVTNTTIVAWYFPTFSDTDTDGVADWYEWWAYGDLLVSGSSDSDGDGFDLLTEYRRGWCPSVSNTVVDGGISARRSQMVTVDLQLFERVEHVQADGVLTNVFTVWPANVTGFNYGRNTAPGAGDWDGDGDLDVFVGASGGVMRVYENIGTKRNVGLADRTSGFGGMAGHWSGIVNPYPALGDWDGNGSSDLAVGGDVGVLRLVSSTTNFAGPHAPTVDYTIDTGASMAIPALADVTGDDRKDLLVLLGDGTVRAYGNTGVPASPFSAGTYTNNILGTAVPQATGMSCAPNPATGMDDILVSDVHGRVWDFRQTTNHSYSLQSRVWGGTGAGFAGRLTMGCGDLDGDGDTDALCGYGLGGLMFLRDPRIGVPTGLSAYDGAASILLTWEPSVHYRFRGFHAYRGLASTGAFSRITGTMLPVPRHEDTNVSHGVTYNYNVTALGAVRYPGFSIEQLVETRPSETVSGRCGRVVLWMSDYSAQTGTVATLKVNAYHASGVAGKDMDIRVLYDPLVIRPVSQAVSSNETVELTAVSQGLTVTNNAGTADGELVITGSGGVLRGEGHIFDVKFLVSGEVASGTVTTNTYSYAYLESEAGVALEVDSTSRAILTVTGTYTLGDVDGNGTVDHFDCVALEQIVAHKRTPTPFEVKAGDMDGNGHLNHLDFKLLHDYHLGKAVNPRK